VSAPFAIDSATGSVSFPDLPLKLRPRMPEEDFIAATARFNRDNLGGNDGWQRYQVRQSISNDRKLGLFVIFLNSRLKTASFAYAQKDESWATWTEEGELAREKEYREELDRQLGGKSSFSWGSVGAKLDSKGGGNDIWVEYS
jgi:hypothetical protein